jgi:hypothetical protein
MEIIVKRSWRVQPPVTSPLTFKQQLGTLFSKHLIYGLPLTYERNSDITYSAHFELNCSFTTPTNSLLILFLYIKGALVAVTEWKVVRDKVSHPHKTNIRETTGKENKTGNTTALQDVRQCSVVYIHMAISKEPAVSVIGANEFSMYPDAVCGRFLKRIRLHGVTSQRTILGPPWERQTSQEGQRLEMDSDNSWLLEVRVEHVLVNSPEGGRTATVRDKVCGKCAA